MNTIPVTQARANIRQLLDQAEAGFPAVLTRNGKPVCVVVPASFLIMGKDFPADERQAEPV